MLSALWKNFRSGLTKQDIVSRMKNSTMWQQLRLTVGARLPEGPFRRFLGIEKVKGVDKPGEGHFFLPPGAMMLHTRPKFPLNLLIKSERVPSMHSCIIDYKQSEIFVKILPAHKDHFMYMLIDASTGDAGIIDAGNAEVVQTVAEAENINISKIFSTHYHNDHTGGNVELLSAHKGKDPPIQIYGADDRIPGIKRKVAQGEIIHVGHLAVYCLLTPSHTTGDVCYFVESRFGEYVIFTGDTLFQGGCGHFIEGTADQMYNVLYDKLATLPDDTKIFCGHEYTVANLAFARLVEPENMSIVNRLEWAKQRREKLLPTVPSTLADEKKWNPFLRVHEESVQNYARETDPIKCLARLRQDLTHFKNQQST